MSEWCLMGTELMKQSRAASRFVLCVRTEDDADVTPRKVYRLLPDKEAADEGFLRIIDDSGEDYLYSEDFFVPITLPAVAQRHFGRISERVLNTA